MVISNLNNKKVMIDFDRFRESMKGKRNAINVITGELVDLSLEKLLMLENESVILNLIVDE